MPWAAAVLSAALLELPFPIAGPMPPWRPVFAWFGLVPLLWALLRPPVFATRRPLRRAFLLGYLCGFLWFCGNCYWVYNTMLLYGDLGRPVSAMLLVLFSAVLGLYFGLFGLGLQLVRRSGISENRTLLFAPFLWVALELAAAHVTSVPWDQLGYSQIDNAFPNLLAPWTGVYGVSFVLVLANALFASEFLVIGRTRKFSWRRFLLSTPEWIAALAAFFSVISGGKLLPYRPAASASAVLIQPNLDVANFTNWVGPEWQSHMAQFAELAGETCKAYITGIPQTGAPVETPQCNAPGPTPDLVVWPEAPAPFEQSDPRFLQSIGAIARAEKAPIVVGGIGMDFSADTHEYHDYNSAMIFSMDGGLAGRYDKIHLVPFGEYIPFQNLLSFAHKLTGRVSTFSRGETRKVFLLSDSTGQRHRYGVFICYEAVFADEVRQFARLGAEVLVNISDDGWYGDTSAPWQHLNMARMRAIENRRWLLRDTNNGVTCVIDPYGRVRQSIPRHQTDALPAQFGFRDDVTFYTAHGDVFAWCCAILSIGAVGWSLAKSGEMVSPGREREHPSGAKAH
jgi:apolipoprotein N-acyltransferase